MFKRILIYSLCTIMLLSLLTGCVDHPQEQESTTPEDEAETWISAELDPSVDLNGTEFTILGSNINDLGPEENSSDPLEDAVYRRNDALQKNLGVTLNLIQNPDYTSLSENIKMDVSAGAGEYGLAYHHMVDSATNLALGGNLYTLTDLDYVDFDQPWWDQDCKNGFMFGDSMFLVCGDLLPSTMLVSATIIFNKNLFDERGWEYPYDDAREGTWTLDDMLELTKDQNKDLNGDGKINYTEDFYGLTGWSLDCDYNFYFGSGCTMFTFDDQHLPKYQANTDRLQEVYEKIYELIITQQAFHVKVVEYLNNTTLDAAPRDIFKQGRALFFAGYLGAAVNMRDMENDFGILPQPKYDEKQTEYLSFVNGSACVAIVPKSLGEQDLKVTGYMMEALASSSYYMVTDTLYDKVAKSKTARDPESAEMIDIIIRHKVFDFGYSHFFHTTLPCASIIQTGLNSKSPSIVKEITKNEKLTIKELKKIYEAYGYEYD